MLRWRYVCRYTRSRTYLYAAVLPSSTQPTAADMRWYRKECGVVLTASYCYAQRSASSAGCVSIPPGKPSQSLALAAPIPVSASIHAYYAAEALLDIGWLTLCSLQSTALPHRRRIASRNRSGTSLAAVRGRRWGCGGLSRWLAQSGWPRTGGDVLAARSRALG